MNSLNRQAALFLAMFATLAMFAMPFFATPAHADSGSPPGSCEVQIIYYRASHAGGYDGRFRKGDSVMVSNHAIAVYANYRSHGAFSINGQPAVISPSGEYELSSPFPVKGATKDTVTYAEFSIGLHFNAPQGYNPRTSFKATIHRDCIGADSR